MGLDNPVHVAFLVVILLLVFGAKRLPEMGRSIGTGMREFKESISGESKPELTHSTEQQAPAPAQPAAAQVQAPAEALAPAPPAQAPVEPTHQA